MTGRNKSGAMGVAIAAGTTAAMAAVLAKFASPQVGHILPSFLPSPLYLSLLLIFEEGFLTGAKQQDLVRQMRWEGRVGCYVGVVACNVAMWTLYVRSLASLSSLQATVLNFAANFLLSGFAGFLIFEEATHFQWFLGAALIVMGIMVLSKAEVSSEPATASPNSKQD
jgi:drug/metabolite transporter (DMT)-like permease